MKYAIGLMSGTSLDGIDACLVKIDGAGLNLSIEQIAFDTYAYPAKIKQQIIEVSEIATSNVAMICALNFDLGKLYSEAVTKLLAKANFDAIQLDFVANHGQTIHHMPPGLTPSTLQIGDSSYIAYDHHVDVVDNFRIMDIVAQGQGAPLVPYTDYVLYSHPTKNRILVNIGGISNFTYLKANGSIDEVIASDLGPGNMIIDALMRHFYDLAYDKDSEIGLSGQLDEALLNELLNDEFITKALPKSCGREQYGVPFVERLLASTTLSAADLIHTLSVFSAKAMIKQFETYFEEIDEIIIAGGGVHNKLMMQTLKDYYGARVLVQEDLGYSSDAKEAIAFALLGYATLNKQYSNVKSASGAQKSVILGKVTYNPHGG